jgi:thiosulfate/3-mercaptopyruvate sulfurtransferase
MITSTPPSLTTSSDVIRDQILVSPDWLDAHLFDPRVRIVEVDISPTAYDAGHIDGAVLWNVYSDVKDEGYRLRDIAAFEQLIRRCGIGRDSIVVFYGYAPALGLWLTKLYGHDDVRILDCSRDSWRECGREWSTTPSHPAVGSYRPGPANPYLRADGTDVLHAIAHHDSTLLDVRSHEEYSGERFWPSGAPEPDGQPGHIPGAIHTPLDFLYNADGSFRSARELRGGFPDGVLDGADELITYCTIGGRAATCWFVLTYLLGRDRVRVYDGSWAEWGHTPGAPIERA